MELFKRTLTSRFAHRLGTVQQGMRFISNSLGIRTTRKLGRCVRDLLVFDSMSTELTFPTQSFCWPGGLVAATVKR